MNPSYTEPALSLRERVRGFVESARFEKSITALIVADAITLGIETSQPVAARYGDSLYVFDRLVLTHTRQVLDEVRELRREIEALRGPSRS